MCQVHLSSGSTAPFYGLSHRSLQGNRESSALEMYRRLTPTNGFM
jgi:hypothetical protein